MEHLSLFLKHYLETVYNSNITTYIITHLLNNIYLYINIYNIVYVITRLLNSVELYFGNVPVSTNNLQTSDVCVHCFYFN